jgi:hypothetical protein
MNRKTNLFVSLSLLYGLLPAGVTACDNKDDINVNCAQETSELKVQVKPGRVQPDGSVTVYGTVQFSDSSASAELAVRSVEVAGETVVPSVSDFNFRSWSVSIPGDRLVAYASGGSRATLPVAVYLYGGCIAQLPLVDQPVVPVLHPDGGVPTDAGPSDAAIRPDAGAQPEDGATTPSDASDDH